VLCLRLRIVEKQNMTREEIEAEVRKSLDKFLEVDFGNGAETVRVLSVDPDGFVCQPKRSGMQPEEDFWVAYRAIVNAKPANGS
jgi:hypothetical protein